MVIVNASVIEMEEVDIVVVAEIVDKIVKQIIVYLVNVSVVLKSNSGLSYILSNSSSISRSNRFVTMY